jgi:uncharacterized protein
MLITSDFEVSEPPDKVWRFFDDIPQVAACLPGAELTDQLGDDTYKGNVAIRMGPVRMRFAANVVATARGSKVQVAQDLQLSGAAAQYGRGMISDVTAVLMRDFATNMQNRIAAIEQGLSPDQISSSGSASGLAIGLRAMRMALARVARRFFLPYQPDRT